jgi:prolyl-tRNA synthetase
MGKRFTHKYVFLTWASGKEALYLLGELKATVRCLPLEQSGTEGGCVVTGKPAMRDAFFAKAY